MIFSRLSGMLSDVLCTDLWPSFLAWIQAFVPRIRVEIVPKQIEIKEPLNLLVNPVNSFTYFFLCADTDARQSLNVKSCPLLNRYVLESSEMFSTTPIADDVL